MERSRVLQRVVEKSALRSRAAVARAAATRSEGGGGEGGGGGGEMGVEVGADVQRANLCDIGQRTQNAWVCKRGRGFQTSVDELSGARALSRWRRLRESTSTSMVFKT